MRGWHDLEHALPRLPGGIWDGTWRVQKMVHGPWEKVPGDGPRNVFEKGVSRFGPIVCSGGARVVQKTLKETPNLVLVHSWRCSSYSF